MDLVVFEKNKALVLQALEQGEFDCIEGASEYVETEFFRFIGTNSLLQELADTYPAPRKKEEVPTWPYIASNLSMRLHGVDAFLSPPAPCLPAARRKRKGLARHICLTTDDGPIGWGHGYQDASSEVQGVRASVDRALATSVGGSAPR